MTYQDLHIIIELLGGCSHPSCSGFINRIAESMNVPGNTVDVMMHDLGKNKASELQTDEEKVTFLIRLVRFLKSEVTSHNDDIKICQELASKIGFEEGVIAELFLHVYSDPTNLLNTESVLFKLKPYRKQ